MSHCHSLLHRPAYLGLAAYARSWQLASNHVKQMNLDTDVEVKSKVTMQSLKTILEIGSIAPNVLKHTVCRKSATGHRLPDHVHNLTAAEILSATSMRDYRSEMTFFGA